MDHKSALRLTALGVAVVFVLFAVMVVVDLLNARAEAAPYFIGDWQINYAAGFVRRGLLGELAHWLFVHFAIDTRTTIVVLQGVFYAVFFGASAILFSPLLARHPMFAFAVFSPMTIAFKALDSGGGTSGLNTTGSKDIVFLALLALQAVLSTRGRSDPAASNARLFVLALLWAGLVLVHEGFFFFLPFSLAVLLLTARTPVRPSSLVLMTVPALLAFALSTQFHGDASAGATICASLGAGAPEGCEKTGAIAWLTRPTIAYIKGTYYKIVQPPYILLTTLQAALLGGIGLVLSMADREVANRVREALKDRLMLIVTIACLVGPLPIFAASDHGRFLHLWFTSAVIALASALSGSSQRDVTRSAFVGNAVKGGALSSTLWIVLWIAYATVWSARGPCCPDRLGSGFFGRVFVLAAERL